MSRAESRMEHFGDDFSQDIMSFDHGQEFADKVITDKVLISKALPGNHTYQQESITNIQKLDGNESHQKALQTIKIQAVSNEKTKKKESGQIRYESKFIEQSNIESKQAIDQQQQKEIIEEKKEVKISKSGKKMKRNIEKKEEKDVDLKDKSTKKLMSDNKSINKDIEEIKSEVQQ